MSQPLAIDLFCGLGGWTEGLLSEGWRVVGFDIERHRYWMPEAGGEADDGAKGTNQVARRGWTQGCAVTLGIEGATAKPRTRLVEYPAQLVLQDVRTLHGSQFKNAHLIVASSPCQEFSYRAMPWKRAKALPPPYFGMELFAQAARIQREASEAAGRYIPMVQENVRGAQKWVGKAAWHYGSYYLWGDVPALMPMTFRAEKNPGHVNQRDGHTHTRHLTNPAEHLMGTKHGGDWFSDPSSPGRQGGVTRAKDGIKQPGLSGPRTNGKGDGWFEDGAARHGSKSTARKAASAAIAKIPFPLAQFIARAWKPTSSAVPQSSEAAA